MGLGERFRAAREERGLTLSEVGEQLRIRSVYLAAIEEENWKAIGAPVQSWLSDVVVSATFRKTGGPPGGGYGLVIRDQGPEPRNGVNQNMDAYVLETGDLGEFGVWRRSGDHWIDLVPWTRTDAVHTGQSPNDLIVRAVGPKLTFLANGLLLAEERDASPAAGMVGVFVGGDMNEVLIDRFSVQVPE